MHISMKLTIGTTSMIYPVSSMKLTIGTTSMIYPVSSIKLTIGTTSMIYPVSSLLFYLFAIIDRGRGGRDRIVVGYTTTYAISAYHY